MGFFRLVANIVLGILALIVAILVLALIGLALSVAGTVFVAFLWVFVPVMAVVFVFAWYQERKHRNPR